MFFFFFFVVDLVEDEDGNEEGLVWIGSIYININININERMEIWTRNSIIKLKGRATRTACRVFET